jgi:UDP-4-amino-4-deoxy-L-arabinose formyltransferase/UDP-glucuronic acid dehydrogenase (UDP-4-keto-hexauronic acid decarboxylating)
VTSYALNADTDRKKIEDLEIDVLLVLGWQRLIPEWLINHCKICAIGAHGSPLGITEGRGRSPQNWALMMGWDVFHVSIFNIDNGIDSGEIIDSAEFEYSQWDDISTSYYKVSMLVSHLIIKNIINGNIAAKKAIAQAGTPFYLPQRLPADGHIDWNRKTKDIYNFIRALSKPYPGAFSLIEKRKITIHKVIPFSLSIEGEYQNGQIVKVFNRKHFLVKTADHFILVTDFETDANIVEGDVLSSYSWRENMNTIIERHKVKHPDLKLNKSILNLE